MKFIKILLTSSILFIAAFTFSGCENTSVSGSVSYGMGMGYGYPMYYGGGYHHSNVVVVRPPRMNRPSQPRTRPSRPRRR
jgi:hypothetical protein